MCRRWGSKYYYLVELLVNSARLVSDIYCSVAVQKSAAAAAAAVECLLLLCTFVSCRHLMQLPKYIESSRKV